MGYADFTPEHQRWLIDKTSQLKQTEGRQYFDRILDQLGVETSIANRVAMPDYLDPAHFRWVFFVDCFFFPFDNHEIASRNPDEQVYIPLQEKLLHRY
ncbi:MAG: amidohydrolase family protein, partial [Gammaproteobacteria bacterium]